MSESPDVEDQVREAALRLLAHRPRSRYELASRLRRRSFPPSVIDAVLDALEERGWVDDPAFARSWVRDRLRLRPRGRNALRAELWKKGVGAAVADAAIDAVFEEEGVTERDVGMELAEAWLRKQPRDLADALVAGGRSPRARKALRRFQGHLARRGLSGGVVRGVLERLREERD